MPKSSRPPLTNRTDQDTQKQTLAYRPAPKPGNSNPAKAPSDVSTNRDKLAPPSAQQPKCVASSQHRDASPPKAAKVEKPLEPVIRRYEPNSDPDAYFASLDPKYVEDCWMHVWGRKDLPWSLYETDDLPLVDSYEDIDYQHQR